MPTLHFTDRALRGLATSKVQEDFYDEVLPAFGVRVGRGGGRTFFVRYRGSDRNRRMTIGSFPAISLAEARDRAKAILGDVARNLDPQQEAERARVGETFGELAALYLERHARVHKRSWKEDERLLAKDVLPKWGRRKASEIKRSDVIELLDGIIDRGVGVLANRVLALVRKIFNWAIGRDLLEVNPCQRVARPAPETRRDRVLSEVEIKTLWSAWSQEAAGVALGFHLLLLTAQRLSEVVHMRRADVDGDLWTLAPEGTKSKRGHVVPLSPQALRLLRSVEYLEGEVWVMPSPRIPGAPLFVDTMAHAARRIAKRTGIEWRVHDLRRTAASHMTAMGVSRLVVSQILNHADHSVTAIYDRHSYLPEMREALTRWGAKVEGLVGGVARRAR